MSVQTAPIFVSEADKQILKPLMDPGDYRKLVKQVRAAKDSYGAYRRLYRKTRGRGYGPERSSLFCETIFRIAGRWEDDD